MKYFLYMPLTLIVFCLASSAGCTRSPQRIYYTLSDNLTADTHSSIKQTGQVTISLGPISVPDNVDRNQIVTRSSSSQLEMSDQNCWSDPLKSEITSSVESLLADSLGKHFWVAAYERNSAPKTPNYRITIDIVRFDSVLGGSATIEANWTIFREGSKQSIFGKSIAHESTNDPSYDAIVIAHRKALMKITKDIVSALIKADTSTP